MGFRKKFCFGATVAIAALAVTTPAFAGSITTIFASDNNHDGNMFNLTTFGNGIIVRSLELNVTGSDFGVDVYSKTGTFVGSETTAADWTLVSTHNGVSSAGLDNPTFIDVTDFSFDANDLYAIYITVRPFGVGDPRSRYTTGGGSYANADLQLDMGVGVGGSFGSDGIFNPRTWNGTINYDLAAVPEPGTMALLGLGLAGTAAWRRRRYRKS